jgi:nitroimidazol reductase NimA-like FMN-containing flavoprotein (pyridoxamine 5'-phosphate oxidase superfamily)
MITITSEERASIEKIIGECKECFVGMIDPEGLPYVIPMNFGYDNDTIYLHSAPEGTSVTALKTNPNVCITFCTKTNVVHQNEEVACSYRIQGSSVICRGKVTFIENDKEKIEALNILMKQYTDKPFNYSEPSVSHVMVWKVEIEQASSKVFGIPYKQKHLHATK